MSLITSVCLVYTSILFIVVCTETHEILRQKRVECDVT